MQVSTFFLALRNLHSSSAQNLTRRHDFVASEAKASPRQLNFNSLPGQTQPFSWTALGQLLPWLKITMCHDLFNVIEVFLQQPSGAACHKMRSGWATYLALSICRALHRLWSPFQKIEISELCVSSAANQALFTERGLYA